MFILFVIGLISSTILGYQLPALPSVGVGFVLLISGLVSLYYVYKLAKLDLSYRLNSDFTRFGNQKTSLLTRFIPHSVNFLAGFLLGANLVFWQTYLIPTVPHHFEGQKVSLQGEVVSLPLVTHNPRFVKLRFNLKLNNLNLQGQVSERIQSLHSQTDQAWSNYPYIVSVNWYVKNHEYKQLIEPPKLGELWRFTAKFKANHASMNPASRDYESWLFHKHIQARVSVSGLVDKQKNLQAEKMSSAAFYNWRVLRQKASHFLNKLLENSEYSGVYKALLIGDKSQINAQQWQVFQQTGTIHLMAISGLHMSIMAAIGFVFFKLLWRIAVYRQTYINRPIFTAFGGILFATLYLLLSGSEIPTQRAWILVVTILGFLMVRRAFRPWTALAMAALLVVLWDERSVLSMGFWLSFGAVVLIFIALKAFKNEGRWQQLIAIQFMLTVGLSPLIFWQFYEIPSYSLLANLIAVPFVTFIGLPTLLLGSIIGLFSIETGQGFFQLVDGVWSGLWWYLDWILSLPKLSIPTHQLSIYWLIGVLLGFGLLVKVFLVRQEKHGFSQWGLLGVIAVYLSAVMLFPYTKNRPLVTHQAWLTVLDVGQGQSIIIETQNHVVVYDAGAKWGESTDAAKVAVLPYLKAHSWEDIDLLMISHSDLDHAGGTQSILAAFPVVEKVTGQADKLNKQLNQQLDEERVRQLENQKSENHPQKAILRSDFKACQSGQKWLFDGVEFSILSPENIEGLSDNDASCVLKVSIANNSVLITGDLSSRGERQLVKRFKISPETLKANLLVAGHHGSKHSSSLDFLNIVNPSQVVFSSGYMNRYRFPNEEVIDRLSIMNDRSTKSLDAQHNVSWWNTACSGALSFNMDKAGVKLRYETRKRDLKWYHHRCLESQKGHLFQ